MKNAASLIHNNLPKLRKAFAALRTSEVLVGVPQEKTERNDSNAKTPINNATIAYLMDNGSPANNVPARPFMRPGIEAAKRKIVAEFGLTAKDVLHDPKIDPTRNFNKIGLNSCILNSGHNQQGIPPELKPATIAARRRARGTKSRRKSELAYMKAIAAGMEPEVAQSAAGITPLVNTGQLRNSITYTIRRKK